MTHSFSISESFKFGWATLKAHSSLVYKVLLTILAVQVAHSVVTKVLAGTVLGILATTVLVIASIILGTGATLISLKLARHEHTTYAEIWPPIMLVVRYLLANLLVAIIAIVPFAIAALIAFGLGTLQSPVAVILAVLVGCAGLVGVVYVLLRFFFIKLTPFDSKTILGSLRKSTEITKGEKWHLLLFLLAIIGVNILGFIVLLVGMLVSIPISMLAFAHVYTKLQNR